MEKEIRMPYSEYEYLLKEIREKNDYIDSLEEGLREKDNVLLIEIAYSSRYRYSIKVLKYPSEDFEVDEMWRTNIEEKDKLIHTLRKENEIIKSKIPWWRR